MNSIIKVQLFALIKDTILKELRSKTLIFLFIATTLMIFLGHALLKFMTSNADNAAIGADTVNYSLSIMFSFINFWCTIVAGIFGISSIRSDFKDKIIYQYLTFPISRWQYLLARIFGAWLLVFGYYLYAYMLSSILFSFAAKTFALGWNHLGSMTLMGAYVFVIIIISSFFSLFTEKIASFLLLFFTVLVISFSTSSFRYLEMSEYFKELNGFKILGIFVYCFAPRVNYLSELASTMMFKQEVKLNIPLESLHLFATCGLILFIINLYIKKKDF